MVKKTVVLATTTVTCRVPQFPHSPDRPRFGSGPRIRRPPPEFRIVSPRLLIPGGGNSEL